MGRYNILLVGFSKKSVNKFQKLFDKKDYEFIDANKLNDETGKIYLIISNWKSEQICTDITQYTQQKQYANVPVLLYTPLNETLILHCYQNGVDDFIDQAWSNEIIKAKIKAFINLRKKYKKDAGKKIKIGNVTINPKKRKVTRKGQEVALTKIEYDILNLLANDPTKIFSREEIYSHIWGRHVIVGERTLDVHMNNLRKKIGKNKIRTKKGIGFSITPDL